jgi:hypothetical protein
MAISLFERHTGEKMFDVLVRFLDAAIPSWRTKCIAVSTDGARSMTGRSQGVVSRFHQVSEPGLIRIWCGLHQLDLVMQRVYKPAPRRGLVQDTDGSYWSPSTSSQPDFEYEVDLSEGVRCLLDLNGFRIDSTIALVH